MRLFKWLWCRHKNVRCIHGDEILNTARWKLPAIARVRCLDCDSALYGVDLPPICTTTKEPHYSLRS